MVSIINVALYFLIFIQWWKNDNIHLGAKFVPLLYLVVATCCCINAFIQPNEWNLSLFPFIYLWICYLLMLYPLRKLTPRPECAICAPEHEKRVIYLVYAYMLFSFFSIKGNIQDAIDAFQSGDWLSVRNNLYWGEEKVYSFWERLYLNGHSFLKPIAFVYFFYSLGYQNKNKLFLFVLCLCVVVVPIISSITSAARGTLFFHVISIITLYSIFSKSYSRKLKNLMEVSFSVTVFLITILVIGITISRFGDEGVNSLLYYFGHSMNCFNYGVFDTIRDYGYGRWFFGDYFSLIDSTPVDKSTDIAYGTHVETAFITLTGCLLIDFGSWGTIVLLIITAFCFRSIRRSNSFSSVYLFYIVADMLINGVFVFGKTYGLIFLIKVMIYKYIKQKVSPNIYKKQ